MAKMLKSATVNEECIERYNELNKGLAPHWRLILFKLNEEESEIEVDHCCDINSTEEEIHKVLSERLSSQSPAWIAMRISFNVQSGGRRDKTTLISWIPDTIKRETMKEATRVKMMALGCTSALKKELKGVVCFVESNSHDELDFDYLLQKAAKHEREPVIFHILF